ncbi:monooxygenase [Penicillium malachiteum]|uniref:monooxygenase n=1 Tax=Penicillium malachiteum TaxID=1324776 RepID=UPI002546F584|nr:monooxygenase [Penicillium malachiteum]KAJ5736902.1 monooxygenase [Penicillium malachiteum]
MAAEVVDVVVVGTGWNGLISAKTYLDLKEDANIILIDEQACIGGVWSEEKIYPSLFAQIKYGLFEYSFYPMRREGITGDGYISGATINTYLNEFARDYDLIRRTRLNTKVIKLERLPDDGTGATWKLILDGDKRPIECEKLIYASGATSHPVMPTWPNQSGFETPIIHSAETGLHLESLNKIQRATVLGGAKSAYDTVFLLLSKGIQVDWIIRDDGTGPLAIMPPTILGLVNSMDVISTKAMAMFGSSIMQTKGVAYQFLQKTRLGRAIARVFWSTVTKIADAHAGYAKSPNAKKLRPLPHGNGIFWANAGLGCASVPDFWKVFHEGHCSVHRTGIESFNGSNTLVLENGTCLETDFVILCTGFDKSYQPFGPELQIELGLKPDPDSQDQAKWSELDARAEVTVNDLLPALKHSPVPPSPHEPRSKSGMGSETRPHHGPSRHFRRLIVPRLAAEKDRSIYFPGFIHSIYTPLVSEVQALWGCAFLLDLVDLPSQEEMEKEVAEWNVWTRKRYLAQGRKHAYAIYDFLHVSHNIWILVIFILHANQHIDKT